MLFTRSVPVDATFCTAANEATLCLPGGERLGADAVAMPPAIAAAAFALRCTASGVAACASGGSRHAVSPAGLPAGDITVAACLLASAPAASAGIATLVTGGTPLTGGAGPVAGTFPGVPVQGLVRTVSDLAGTPSSRWAGTATGSLVFIAARASGTAPAARRRMPGLPAARPAA